MFQNSYPMPFHYQQPIVRQATVAIFLDAENIHARHLEFIVDKARHYGTPLNCRAYADWSNPRLKPYAGRLTKYGFVAIHHFATQMGKNSSDMMLSVDAMKIMYQSDRPDVVVLATSDSDFSSLAVQLRALGVMVVGVGNMNASDLLKDACNVFYRILESDSGASSSKSKPALKARTTPPAPLQAGQADPNKNTKLIKVLNELLDSDMVMDNGKVSMSNVGTTLIKNGISADGLGFVNVTALINSLNEFEVSKSNAGSSYVHKCLPFVSTAKANNTPTPATPTPISTPEPTPAPMPVKEPVMLDDDFNQAVAAAIAEHKDENGWARVARVAVMASSQFKVSSANYGYATWSDALGASDVFELRAYQADDGVQDYYVRDTRMVSDELDGKNPTQIERSKVVQEVVRETVQEVVQENAPIKKQATTPAPNKKATAPVPAPNPAPKSVPTPVATPTLAQDGKIELTADKIDELRQVIVSIMQEKQDGEVWFSVASLGSDFRKKGYDPKAFGCKTLGVLISKMGIYETKTVGTTALIKDPAYVPVPKVEKIATHNTAQAVSSDLPKITSNQVAGKVLDLINEVIMVADEVIQMTKTSNANQPNETVESVKVDVIDEVIDIVKTNEIKITDEEVMFGIKHTLPVELSNNNIDNEVVNNEQTDNHHNANNDNARLSLDDLLVIINQAIAVHQNADGYAKVGDIGKYVRKEIGLGATSFGYDDFGKMLELLPQYEVVRIGRSVMVKIKGK